MVDAEILAALEERVSICRMCDAFHGDCPRCVKDRAIIGRAKAGHDRPDHRALLVKYIAHVIDRAKDERFSDECHGVFGYLDEESRDPDLTDAEWAELQRLAEEARRG